MGGARAPPLHPKTIPTRENGLFAAICRAIPKPKSQEVRNNAWISEDTWRLAKERIYERRDPERKQNLLRHLGREINISLKGDRKRGIEEAGYAIERLMVADTPVHKESWHWMKGWYKAVVDNILPPALATLEQITVERVDLYRQVQPPGNNITISVNPFQWRTWSLRRKI